MWHRRTFRMKSLDLDLHLDLHLALLCELRLVRIDLLLPLQKHHPTPTKYAVTTWAVGRRMYMHNVHPACLSDRPRTSFARDWESVLNVLSCVSTCLDRASARNQGITQHRHASIRLFCCMNAPPALEQGVPMQYWIHLSKEASFTHESTSRSVISWDEIITIISTH